MKKLFLLFLLTLSIESFSQYNSNYTVAPVTSSVNLPLIQQTLASRQNAYNANASKVDEAVREIYKWLSNSGIERQKQENIGYAFNRFFVQPVYDKGYDYSDTMLTGRVIDYLFESFRQVYKDEMSR